MGDDNGIDAGYGRAKVGAHGALGVVALLALVLIGSTLWLGSNVFASVTKEHESMRAAMLRQAEASDRLACVVSLTNEERLALRRYSKSDFWSKCPWIYP